MMQQPPPAANGAAAAGPGDQQAYHHHQQSWMMQPHQAQPAAGWNPQSAPSLGQPQQYSGGSQTPGSGDEIRSLWIGDLQPWMDESYLVNSFSITGELSCLLFAGGYQNPQGNAGESDLTNTTVSTLACAEQGLNALNGTQLGGQSIRLSWGRTTSNKQTQPDQAQYGGGGGYYGYPPQGYEGYGYAPPPQDPNAYYGGYPGAGYGNYQQPGGGYQQQQQVLLPEDL
ncbi:hypothetical protein HID58_030045 [Brassica napus]|uniref:RRM domain-containing protein n=1 Tax=Brassica napus TaxID=3708 RepID=A0ABQ8CET4_BRANA|nr:hypothetical protein HID58_030045 [Brassica napus]